MFGQKKQNPSEITENVDSNKIFEEEVDKEIVVHVMPRNFNTSIHSPRGNSAKTTGILILVLGFVALVAMAGGGYYFLFMSSPGKPAQENNVPAAPQPNINLPVETKPTSTPVIIENNNMATSTATSTIITDETPTSTQPVSYILAADTDQDGLSDLEEIIFGANKDLADTNNNGYNDGTEVKNLYNPSGKGKLADSAWMKRYSTDRFELLYPTEWSVKNIDGNYSVIFTSADNQMIMVNVEKNDKKQSIIDWYREKFSQDQVDINKMVEHKNSSGQIDWRGIKNEDGLVMYITDANNDNLITITYTVGLGTVLNYSSIYEIAINSLNIK